MNRLFVPMIGPSLVLIAALLMAFAVLHAQGAECVFAWIAAFLMLAGGLISSLRGDAYV